MVGLQAHADEKILVNINKDGLHKGGENIYTILIDIKYSIPPLFNLCIFRRKLKERKGN